ncbi:hypothetical protein NW762_010469 [Fusarium torreyae]|uniref:Uncharacterized protein n=1 Tax=Fusarium torreyae TaxID=1237075 RepID=A0A9W8VA71_9HYPO|nr:hypothetical protein NW762_010469 [Fusarium torreyae]
MDERPALPSERVAALQSFLEQGATGFHPTKSPEEVFQEKYDGARALFNDALHPLESDSEALGDQDSRLDALLHYGKQVKELKAQREAEKQNEEREYQDILWRQQKSLAFDFLDIFGPLLIDVVVKEWHERAAQRLSTSTQPDTIPDRIGSQSTKQTTPPNTNDEHHSPRQVPVTAQPATQTHANEPIPTRPTTEGTVEQGTSSSATQPSESEQSASTTQQKRRASSPSTDTTHYEKRLRFDDLPDPLTGYRSIEFEQVFQNGNAEVRYVIAPYNERWYILECKDHEKHFLKNPISGASKHLRGEAHGGLCMNYRDTIRMLGTRVLNCREELVEMNNRVARRSSYNELGQPESSLTVSATSAPSGNTPTTTHNGPHTRSSEAIPGIDPQPGDIYTTYWRRHKTFYAVLILPWGSFRQFGWDISLKDTKLMKKIPACYIYDPDAGEEAIQWAPAYKPGGPSFAKRKYPIVYFDKRKFAEKCSLGWVAACNFRHFDPHDERIPFRDTIEDFISFQSEGTGNELEEPHSTLNQDNVTDLSTAHGDASVMSDLQATTHTHSVKERFSGPGSSELIVISDDDDDDDGEPDERSTTQPYQHDEREVKQSPQPSTPERCDHRVTDDNMYRPQGVMESGQQFHSGAGMFDHSLDENRQGEESNGANIDAQARTGDNNTLSSHSNLVGSAEYLESLNPFGQSSTNIPNTDTLQQSDSTCADNTATRNPHADSPSRQATTSHATDDTQPNNTIAPLPPSQRLASTPLRTAYGILAEQLQAGQAPLMREASEHARLARNAMEKYHWVSTLSPVKPTAPPAPMVQGDSGFAETVTRTPDQNTPQTTTVFFR